MERIEFDGQLLALILWKDFEKKEGPTFFTENELSQQFAYMKYPKGHRIQPHIHLPYKRVINDTMEVIAVKSGRVAVDFFFDEHTLVKSLVVSAGDFIVLCSGGHGFRFLEDGEIFEIKQGPFAGSNADKKRFHYEGY